MSYKVTKKHKQKSVPCEAEAYYHVLNLETNVLVYVIRKDGQKYTDLTKAEMQNFINRQFVIEGFPGFFA